MIYLLVDLCWKKLIKVALPSGIRLGYFSYSKNKMNDLETDNDNEFRNKASESLKVQKN